MLVLALISIASGNKIIDKLSDGIDKLSKKYCSINLWEE